MAHIETYLTVHQGADAALRARNFVHTALFDTKTIDYAVTQLFAETLPAKTGIIGADPQSQQFVQGGADQTHSVVEVQRKGDWVYPVEVLFTFADGSTETKLWSGEEGVKRFHFTDGRQVMSAAIDPHHKLLLDLDLNNNSMTLQPERSGLWRYTGKSIFWLQNLLQSLNFLI
jgi:hypothetical protein